jgi:SAM-dependent methyltransferase
MDSIMKKRPSLENLIEGENLGLEILHPGGLDTTNELAQLCNIGKDSLVLDVASGTGESACFLAEKLGARVMGMDASDYMVERATDKAKQRNLNVEFKTGDAHSLPFAEDTFDAVISECTVCLLDKEKVVREMLRVVKPGGHVGIHDICWKEDTPERFRQRLAEIEGERPETLEGWKALFDHAGLVDIKAVDKSYLIPLWVKEEMRELGFAGSIKLFSKILKIWGISGLGDVWESERIFQSKHTGYAIVVGRKPTSK